MNEERSSDDSSAYEEEHDSNSAAEKQLNPSPTEVFKDEEKIFSRLTKIADELENPAKARRTAGTRRHMNQRIKDAKTFEEKDKLIRDLASFCFNKSKKFAEAGDVTAEIGWVKLLLRFLNFAQEVREQGDHEELRKAIAELKERGS